MRHSRPPHPLRRIFPWPDPPECFTFSLPNTAKEESEHTLTAQHGMPPAIISVCGRNWVSFVSDIRVTVSLVAIKRNLSYGEQMI